MFVEILIAIVGIYFILQYFHYGSKPKGTPPGTVGLPIVGVLPPRNCTFEDHINKYRKKYGETFWLKMGSRNLVFICEYDDIVTAFNNPALQGRPDFFSSSLVNKGEERGVALSTGIHWKNLRRFTIRRLRDGGMGKSSIANSIMREAEALADDFENYVGKPIELPWSINGSIVNVIWKLVSDKRFEPGDLECHKLYQNMTEIINQIQGTFMLLFDLMPWMEKLIPEFIQNVCGKKAFLVLVDNLATPLYKTVEDHKNTIDEGNPRDLIDSYIIELNKQTKDSEDPSAIYSTFCENELVYLILDLFSAGSETTSSTIRWYLLLMAKYPQIQDKVHDELDRIISNGRTVTMEDKENLPFFDATINETLRLKPIAAFGLFHVVTEDTTLNEYLLPKGTYIMANLQACHKNPKFWKKPNEFYPEHFLKEDSTFNQKTRGFLPFSIGRRVCLGENLARMDLYFVLATIMQRFSFTAPEGEPLSTEQHPEQPFFTIPRPFKLIINKR